MSGRGKGGKAKTKAKSRSSRAGLQFPVGRLHRSLREGNYAVAIGSGAPVRMAAVLEYLTELIFESAGITAGVRIARRHLEHAILNNAELNKLYEDMIAAKKVPELDKKSEKQVAPSRKGGRADRAGRGKVAKKGEKRAGKKGGRIGAISEKKQKKKRVESFSIYIYKVLKLVYPDTSIESTAMSFMNMFVNGVFALIASEASRNCSANKSTTLSEQDVQAAVNLVVTGNLATSLDNEGTIAVAKYGSSKL